jgi:hypothetical protein
MILVFTGNENFNYGYLLCLVHHLKTHEELGQVKYLTLKY